MHSYWIVSFLSIYFSFDEGEKRWIHTHIYIHFSKQKVFLSKITETTNIQAP